MDLKRYVDGFELSLGENMDKIVLILQKKGTQVLTALLPQSEHAGKPPTDARNIYVNRLPFCPSDAPQVGQYGLDIISTALLGENRRKHRRLSPFLSPSAFDQASANTSKEDD